MGWCSSLDAMPSKTNHLQTILPNKQPHSSRLLGWVGKRPVSIAIAPAGEAVVVPPRPPRLSVK
ncbi:MAG: hypothetical protein D6680_16705 [Cyanobacteria bacterium J007]|nr:MAG: hypothetical protein D6680_16705 [Cyanobacteria bacterium J007]